MINKCGILHECHSGDFTCHAGEKSAGLLSVVPYHHEIVVELREYSFDTFAESFVSPRRRMPILLIQPIWNFKCDICGLEEIFLNLCAEIAFVTEHHTVMAFPAYIIKIMKVVDARRRHVIGVYDATYSADSMELISVIIQTLRCAIPPVWGSIDIVPSHDTTFCPCVLAYLDRLGANAEHIFGAIYCRSHIPANFLGKACRQLPSGVELPSANQVRQILLAFIVQEMKQEIFTVDSHDFKIGKFGNNATAAYISKFINTTSCEILADFEDSDFICYEVVYKLYNSS